MLHYINNFHPKACDFIDAAALTVENNRIALNELTKQLINNNLWDKGYLINPVIGGAASSHKFNLKDPRDLDAAFRLTFYGGITHSTTGMAGNGINGYYDTNLNDLNVFLPNSLSIFVYLRTNFALASSGDILLGGGSTFIISRNHLDKFQSRFHNTATKQIACVSSLGLFGMSTTVDYEYRKYVNAAETTVAASVGTQTNANYLGMRYSSTYNSREHAFLWFGVGLTSAEVLLLYNIIQAYQTQLGRQV